MRLASVQAIDVKFSQDLKHQKSLKSVKNEKVDVFWDTVYIISFCCGTKKVPTMSVNPLKCSSKLEGNNLICLTLV